MRDLLSDSEAARILGKRRTQLYRIVDLFDADPNDEWELEEGVHFEFAGTEVPGTQGQRPRRFTEEGVEALARYIETHEQPNLLSLVRDRLFQAKKKRKQLLVSRRITQEFVEAGGTVEIRGALAFVTRKSTVSILQTNYKGLANSWERLRQAGMEEGEEALEIGKDFLESEARQLLLSQRGIAAVARDMRVNSKITKARRAWIEAVGEVVETCFQAEIRYLTDGAERAVKRAKAAAGHRCEVTGKKSSRQTRIDLAGHHLFDRTSRPDLSDLADNVLVLLPDLHRDFHSWKPGPCCPADFLRFLSNARGDLFDPANARSMARLHNLTRRLNRLQKEREGLNLRYHKR
jgi:hypothetical protein